LINGYLAVPTPVVTGPQHQQHYRCLCYLPIVVCVCWNCWSAQCHASLGSHTGGELASYPGSFPLTTCGYKTRGESGQLQEESGYMQN